jgi:hypothetical protein
MAHALTEKWWLHQHSPGTMEKLETLGDRDLEPICKGMRQP